MENKILKVLERIENKIDGLENRIDGLENRMDGLENKMDGIESQVKENTQILKALEHKMDVVKAEQNNIIHNIAEVQGDLKNLRNELVETEIITKKNSYELALLKRAK